MPKNTNKIATLDMFDVRRKAEHALFQCQHIEKMLRQICRAPDDMDQDELVHLIDMIGYEYVGCSADLKAIRRLIK